MWYQVNEPALFYSPSLVFYRERIINNIKLMISMAGDPDRLIPHVKTHKTKEIVLLQMEQGISKFKCATIAEAEMIASAGCKWILIAYQLVGPHIERLVQLKLIYPDVQFASLVDDAETAVTLNEIALKYQLNFQVFVDVNNGMNRSGHPIDEYIIPFLLDIQNLSNIEVKGIHLYDGHIHNSSFEERLQISNVAFDLANDLIQLAKSIIGSDLMIIAGGSPTFTVHTLRANIYLSPGTNVLWDAGYGEKFKDQPFNYAAVILTRIISKPIEGIITIDAGHKSIAAENPIEKRLRILNLSDYTVLSQSEEHGVIMVPTDLWEDLKVGDVLYALPYHICPTVALHEYADIVENGDKIAEWQIVARKRKITI